ncbi:putative endoglucanase X [Podospora australis]|uniref:Endoglucanase X n=1 Tax=Podospora australis TaxID=1536484 RepID=A0AAN7AD73_9PEZI|nr:putative endoglucanase X [Podospora australis]
MPLGDSITDYGCWRAWIWERFQNDGHSNVDLVGGELAGENCRNLDFDRDHEGHPGFPLIDIAAKNQLVGWLSQNNADVVTVHLGTVDIVRGTPKVADLIAALGKLVDQMRASNAVMRIIIAQIIPQADTNKNRLVQEYNRAIPAFAASKNITTSPIWVVDQWTGFSTADLSDGIHAAPTGIQKIADKFYPALVRAIESIENFEETLPGFSPTA